MENCLIMAILDKITKETKEKDGKPECVYQLLNMT
jgi:hypothetical protein